MTTRTTIIAPNVKSLLEKGSTISVGDIVTIDDNSNVIDTYVVKSISNNIATICGIQITEEKDDVFIYDTEVDIEYLIYLGDSFVNFNGLLWKIKTQIDNGIDPSISFM